jgi:hypothetical protein
MVSDISCVKRRMVRSHGVYHFRALDDLSKNKLIRVAVTAVNGQPNSTASRCGNSRCPVLTLSKSQQKS